MSALLIPSLGAPELAVCLDAVARLEPAPQRVLVVLSGPAAPAALPPGIEVLRCRRRLGFAAAVNHGLVRLLPEHPTVALLNDDTRPSTEWLGALSRRLDADPGLAAVQGTVSDASGGRVDGRGIAFDRFALPVQVDHGADAALEPGDRHDRLAVSATAALFSSQALAAAALSSGEVFDSRFGSYHEDLDLGLRLRRLGWRAGWVAGAQCRHLGSVSGLRSRWRHPWWLLANRWRALAGNLRPSALLRSLPRLLCGELRAVSTLARDNPRAAVAAAAVAVAVPWITVSAWRRRTAGCRIARLEELLQ